MNTKYTMILFISLLIGSCTNKEKTDYSITNNKKGTQIKVNYKNGIETFINADTIIKNVTYIPLENTNPPIGEIGKILFCNEKIIIMDKDGKSIWIFNRDGKLYSHISKLGKGPKEYRSMENVSITCPDTVNVVDAADRSIAKYNFNGEFVGKKKITKGWPATYAKMGNYRYVHLQSHLNTNQKKRYYLYIMNGKEYIKGFFPYTGNYRFGRQHILSVNNKLYAYKSYDNNIYRLENDQISIAFSFDFGEKSFPRKKIYNAESHEEYDKILSSTTYVGNINRFYKTKKTITFDYDIRKDGDNRYKALIFIYKIYSGKSYNYERVARSKKYIEAPTYPDACDGKYFYSLINPWRFSKDKYKMKKLSKRFGQEYSMESNPILMKYQYK